MKKIVISSISLLTITIYIISFFMGRYQQILQERISSSIPEPSQIFLPSILKNLGYFVAPNGSDTNPGTFALPWRTIGKAASIVMAGNIIYIREGTYHESVRFRTSGTASSPIRILAYPGENPVMDGNNSIPEIGGSLLTIIGDYIYAAGIEVRNSAYEGIRVQGNYDVVDNVYVHHCQSNGITIIQGHYSIVENSRVWRNSLINEFGVHNWGAGITAIREGVSYATIRHNLVWENWGEGISSVEANQVIIEDNITHDNWSTNIYISDSTNVLCQRNFVYMDPGSYIYVNGSYVGIMMGDEKYTPPSANISIINNVAYGNSKNFEWWSGVQGGGMNNVLIANNTFVNSMPNNTGGRNVDIGSGPHQNVRIMNNLIVQDDVQPIEDITINPQVVLSHNLWSKSPRAEILGSGDIIGDPKLARTGTPFSYFWYELTVGSPAIDHALSLSNVIDDFLRKLRGIAPDIGALEFQ